MKTKEECAKKTTGTVTSTPSATPTKNPEFSYYEDLFKKEQELFDKPDLADLTGDGEEEVIYMNIGEGCGSCHAKYFHIFSGKKEIFSKDFDDSKFFPLVNGFLIVEPIRKPKESYCCPTSYKYSVYKWDGKQFNKQ